jgi:hypothetical protein
LIREGGVDIREGQSPSPKPLPSPIPKGRGIQGEGLVNNLERADLHSAQFSCKMGETSLRKKFSR